MNREYRDCEKDWNEMYKYIIMPENKNEYIVYADQVETNGEWLLFYKRGENLRWLVHTCSSHYTKYVSLYEEE